MKRTRLRIMTLGLLSALTLSVFAQGTERFVAQDGQTPDPAGEFTSWANAASNIQDAVDAAVNGDTVIVRAGTYGRPPNPVVTGDVTNMVSISRWITVRSESGKPEETVIDAGGHVNNRCVRIFTQFSAAHDSTIRLSGFTLTNGYANGGGVFFDVSNWVRTGIVENCIIVGNQGITRGGGIDAYFTGTTSPDIIIADSVIRNNTVDGMYKRLPGKTTVTGCIFEHNSGNTLYLYSGSHLIENTVFRDNSMIGGGYGSTLSFWHSSSNNVVRNSLFHDNHFDPDSFASSAIDASWNVVVNLYNCTIANNTISGTSTDRVAVRAHHNSSFNVWNSIVYGNTRDGSTANYGGTVNFSHSLSTGTMPGDGNVNNQTPGFADPDNGDFRLGRGSPCINTGLYQSWMDAAVDLDENPRIDRVTGLVDMGAFEYLFAGTTILIR